MAGLKLLNLLLLRIGNVRWLISKKGHTLLPRERERITRGCGGEMFLELIAAISPKFRVALVLALILLYLKLRRRKQSTSLSENMTICNSTSASVACDPISTPSGCLDGATVHVTILQGNPSRSLLAPDLVCVHGANSDGLGTWHKLVTHPRITTMFARILVIDLPGFGKSTITNMPSQSQDVQDAYAQIISRFIDRPSVVIAHSMGCVLSSSLADHPLVKGIVWICPIGAMPTLGVTGAWWSLLFEYGFPHRHLNALGPVMGQWLLWLLGGSELVHMFGSLTAPTATGYRAPQRLVGKSKIGRHFADPWLYKVVRKLQTSRSCPLLVFVSGAQDSFVPPHIADMTHRTLVRYCPNYTGKTVCIPDAGHSIQYYSPHTLVRCLQWVLDNTTRTPTPTPTPTPPTPNSFPSVGYMTSFSPRHTRQVIASLYQHLEEQYV